MRSLFFTLLLLPLSSMAMMQNDRTVTYSLDKLERWQWQNAEGEHDEGLEWQAGIRVGNGYDFVHLYSEGEHVNGSLEESQTRLLYQRAVSPFWDLQLGLEHLNHEEDEDRLVLGLKGTAPYFIELDALLLISDEDNSQLDIEAGYELMLTQRLMLELEADIDWYLQSNSEAGHGVGIQQTELELHMGYAIKPELVPYWGLRWQRAWGERAKLLNEQAEQHSLWGWFVGVSFWY